MTEKSNLSTAPQREAPWLEVLVQESGEDIPELTERSVCRVKASSGALYVFNRGGTVEFQLHPQCDVH